MDDPQNFENQSLRDRAWTTDEIRKHSSNWTLAGDVGLFNLLNEFSHQIISRTHEVENAVDSLVHQTKMTSAKINNTINDFHMLSNLQFVENRVYDEEVQEPVNENKPVSEKTKEQKESEMLPKIVKAIELGLAVLDTAFDRINVNELSDSEDEEDISSEGRIILEPKDPYEHRPLPYIIGSDMFMKCDYAGLKDLVEEEVQSFSEESNMSESDSTSSDEEPLPLDDDRFSEKQIDQVSRNISDKISSSDESELFGSEKDEKEVNGFESDSSLEFKTKEKNIQRPPVDAQPQKETRQNSVSSLQERLKLPQVLPVPKIVEKKKDEDLFGNEENSDDESPFRKKTGLFTSEVRFDDEKDGDLFGGDLFGKSPSKEVKDVKPVEVPKVSSKQSLPASVPDKKKPVLFDNDDDSEDDFFKTLMKSKEFTLPKTSNAANPDSYEKADSLSTPSSAPSTTPGNAFDFVTGGGGNGNSLFGDDSDGDELFSTKKMTQGKKFDTSENDDLFGIGSKSPKSSKVTSEAKTLFEDSIVSEQQPKKTEPPKSVLVKKKVDSIFGDSDSDKESPQQVKSSFSAPEKNKTDINLFGDDDFEDDIFTQASKKSDAIKAKKDGNSSLFGETKQISIGSQESKPVKAVGKAKPLSLFDDEKSESEESKPVKEVVVEKPKKLSLFDDTEEESSESSSIGPKNKSNKNISLFEDSDNFDLFAPKPPVKKPETLATDQMPKPVIEFSETKNEIHEALGSKVPKPVMEISKTKDESNGALSSKVSSLSKDVNIDNQVSFDTPVGSSNILNVINKDRVKVAAKRRKPTRQGRLAALENSEKEAKTVVESAPVISNPDTMNDSTDNLFASVTKTDVPVKPSKIDYKTQEKKKMNLMSQLISEVATSKIALKKAVDKEDEEDEVDIFSEVAQKDRSKSSFSFLPPEENGIAAMFPVEKENEKTDLNESNSDGLDDDFFTEPSFRNFRSSISKKNPVLNLDDDDDDDDLFRTVITNVPKSKPETSDADLFDDNTDIFADIQKEKYEMFPSQVYEDEDDDIFGNMANPVSNKASSSSKPSNSSSIKKVETQQVNAFDDPLTGLLGDD